MAKKRILIVGDSFCAPNDYVDSWHQRLSLHWNITNRARCGVGQYKIHKQLSHNFDLIIYAVTSPYRQHIEQNPFYDITHPSHGNCDLIYQDIVSRLPDTRAQHIAWWFENVVDTDHNQYVHNLIVKDDCAGKNILPISFFDCSHCDVKIENFHTVWKQNPGSWNHLSEQGHRLVFDRLQNIISDQLGGAL